MDLKEINETFGSQVGIQMLDGGINLITFYDLRNKVKCNGDYKDYYCYVWRNSAANRITDRIYFDPNTDEVIQSSYDWVLGHLEIPFHYDASKNCLVDQHQNKCEDSEYIKYYKCCKADVPYFKPLTIEGNLTMDCELNIYCGDKLVANLSNLINILQNPTEYDKNDISKLYNFLTGFSIKVSDLPKIYQNYISLRGVEGVKNRMYI